MGFVRTALVLFAVFLCSGLLVFPLIVNQVQLNHKHVDGVKELEATVNNLQDQLKRASEVNDALQRQYNAEVEKSAPLAANQKKLDGLIEQLTNDSNSLRARLTTMSQDLAASEKLVLELREASLKDQQSLVDALQKHSDLSGGFKQREEAHSNTQTKLSECSNALQAAGARLDGLQVLQQQLLDAQQETTEAHRQLAATSSTVSGLEEELKQKDAALKEAWAGLEQARTLSEEQRGATEGLYQRVEELNQSRDRCVADLVASREELATATARISDLTQSLNTEQTKFQTLIEDLTTERAEKEKLYEALQQALRESHVEASQEQPAADAQPEQVNSQPPEQENAAAGSSEEALPAETETQGRSEL